MMAEKFSHSFSQQQQKMRINEFKWDGAGWAHAPGSLWLNGGCVSEQQWFIFISMPPMPPPPKFDAPSSWHSNWNANSDECAHVARLGSVHRLEGCRRRRRRLTTFYGKWATYPPTYGMGYNRKYTCAYAPSTYDHINQYTSTYVLLFAYVCAYVWYV